MRTGQFRYRIIIYTLVNVKDDYGGVKQTLQQHKTCKASRKFTSGLMKNLDNQISAVQTVEFTIRFDFSIVEDMVVKFKGEKYRVTYVYHTHEQTTTMRAILTKDDKLGE